MNTMYVAIALFALFSLYLRFQNKQDLRRLPELLLRGAVVVDVRSPSEFAMGAAPQSINIPLDTLEGRMGELDSSRPIILCCASGNRASRAASLLKARGFRKS